MGARQICALRGLHAQTARRLAFAPTRAGEPLFPESHQRSWWIVHTQPTRTGAASPVFPNPTNAVGGSFILSLHGLEQRPPFSRIPPTQLVDCSYSAYTDWSSVPRFSESHQPSWWIGHTRAIRRLAGKMANPVRLSMNNPPTALVGFGDACGRLFCRLSMNNPPTALVGFEGRPRLWVR